MASRWWTRLLNASVKIFDKKEKYIPRKNNQGFKMMMGKVTECACKNI